jgi:hypothetical protein
VGDFTITKALFSTYVTTLIVKMGDIAIILIPIAWVMATTSIVGYLRKVRRLGL